MGRAFGDDGWFEFATADVWGCVNAFEFACPRYWESLAPTADPGVRFCAECRQPVYRCDTPAEFVAHGEQGRCVAVPEGRAPLQMIGTRQLGRPTPESVREAGERTRAARTWWRGVLAAEPRFAPVAVAAVAAMVGPADSEAAPDAAPGTSFPNGGS